MKTIKKFLTGIILGSILVSFTQISGESMHQKEVENDPGKELVHFPEAKPGMMRHVIILDKKNNEEFYKVELIPGKIMKVDCNKHTLLGKTEEKELEGWGYSFYEFSSEGKTISTRMACPQIVKQEKFISSESIIITYNSKLPIVIYTPQGYIIKYKIWEAGKEKTALVK
ncbi:serine protease inhibitor ecotin [Apibacter mensalis]|uniref:serine protease inhibitor ecotin n=1 Tax=Apibacter mensalis TaxID=1586267 RepID=UPI0026EEBAE8|nr:serine protease inhibitor ecotin [Apibacter mensalis]